MKLITKYATASVSLFLLACYSLQGHAAIALDRTRVVFDGGKNSMAVTISNQNKSLPYLAQTWVEDPQGKKVDSPLMALPPLQRVEPGAKGQIKLQTTSSQMTLPQDRESLFYFNVREIPPKSDKPNTLQLALQTRVKLFYRPAALAIARGNDNEPPKMLTLTRQSDSYIINNPTPYYVTIVDASTAKNATSLNEFKPVMISPKGSAPLGVSAGTLGNQPVLTFINDFGGRPKLLFACTGDNCAVSSVKAG